MKTAVVILNYNGEKMLEEFLPSVLRFTDMEEAQVIVADNASTDNSISLLENEFPQVPVIRLTENWGFAEGYNKALSQIDAQYYLLLNSDVMVSENWLQPLVACLDRHSDVAAAQPKLLKYTVRRPLPQPLPNREGEQQTVDIPPQENILKQDAPLPYRGGVGGEAEGAAFEYAGAAGGFIDRWGYPYCRGRIFSDIEQDNGQYDEPMEIHWATGACMLIRSEDYWKAGGLDGRFFAHNEEIDLCWRLRIMGRRIMCLPQSKVYHLGGGTLPQGNPRKTYLNFRNNLTMLYKNLPEEELKSVMRMRYFLDRLAALQSFVTGNRADAKAIFKARKDFCNWKDNYKKEREMIQNSRQNDSRKDTNRISILWQYYVLGRKKWSLLPIIMTLLLLSSPLAFAQTAKTRGIGIYPGRAEEAFLPVEKNGFKVRRNLALNRMVYHSSAYDYSLTGQLVTDGIFAQTEPPRLETYVNDVPLPKHERERTIDGNDYTRNTLPGSDVSLRLHWAGMEVDVDSVMVNCIVVYDEQKATKGYSLRISDGRKVFANDKMTELPGEKLTYQMASDPNKQGESSSLPARFFKRGCKISVGALSDFVLEMNMPGAAYWQISDLRFYKKGKWVATEVLPMSRFESVWMSEKGGDQWAYVDLGANSNIEEVRLCWMFAAPTGRVEVSQDAKSWSEIAKLPVDGLPFYIIPVKTEGRYVRVSVEGSAKPYMLSEMEVIGYGGKRFRPAATPAPEGNRLSLNGGGWQVQRSSAVEYSGEIVATGGYPADNWMYATVPATVLGSYVNAKAVPDQNYDYNVEYASEAYFYSNFFYRRQFILPKEFKGKKILLNLDGINWKAQLWLNGARIGRVEGAFARGVIDITSRVRIGNNTLAIEIERPDYPGGTKEKTLQHPSFNGGILGFDNPTFHASIGWDWLPCIRGRNIGIWNDIYIIAANSVTLTDPVVLNKLNLPDTLATLTPSVKYRNNSGQRIKATAYGWIGDVRFQKTFTINPGRGVLKFKPEEHAELRNQRMRLWWPNNTHGEPYLHDAGFCLVGENGDTLSTVEWKHGVRQYTYQDVDTSLKMFVNGRRVVPLGGNWGFSEQNLNFRQREYDIAVRYHRDMNFNMIRNWVGQIGDEEFYDACDKYGIMVWQDFWLANPVDGPDPADEELFVSNAIDYVSKIRRHPSVALYCGRNEGYPTKTLDDNLRRVLYTSHPDIQYISSSADEGVSGHGPYDAHPAKDYFERQTGKFHSERGMPNIMTIESLRRTMRQENLWPKNDVWGHHNYNMEGAQHCVTLESMMNSRFGEPQSAEEFTALAQWINYEGFRAMYEASYKDRLGLLIWMSHSCWPSMVYQTYDYYFEPTAACFGTKKACEPLHIQYNALTGKVEVVNLGIGDFKKLKARIEVFDINGKLLSKTTRKVKSLSDSTIEVGEVSGDVVRLSLFNKKQLVSENTYVLAAKMPKMDAVEVEKKVSKSRATADGKELQTEVTLRNKGEKTAYMLRLNLTDGQGTQILPVRYSDNYFHLMPGEERTVSVNWAAEDQQSDGIDVKLTGYNVRFEM